MTPRVQFPGGARFAFTVMDDTDVATVENVRPIYRLLDSLGMRTTKTVWPMPCEEGSRDFLYGGLLAREDHAISGRARSGEEGQALDGKTPFLENRKQRAAHRAGGAYEGDFRWLHSLPGWWCERGAPSPRARGAC